MLNHCEVLKNINTSFLRVDKEQIQGDFSFFCLIIIIYKNIKEKNVKNATKISYVKKRTGSDEVKLNLN